MPARRRSGAAFGGVVLASVLAGCVTVEAPAGEGALGGTPGYDALPAAAPEPGAPQPFVGLTLEESLAGGLDALEFQAGLRVAQVAAGSPAEQAGLRAGDRLLRAGAAELARTDEWAALLARQQPGATLLLAVERAGGVRDVRLPVAARAAQELPEPTRFIERRRARCTVETTVAELEGGARTCARLVELAPTSPLRAAGLAAGTVIIALDGVAVGGAADFVRRIARLPFGTDIELRVVEAGAARDVELELAGPERHLTGLALWPLLTWRETTDESEGELTVVDLWLLWLFKHEHDGGSHRYSLLRFIRWETGEGALAEDPAR